MGLHIMSHRASVIDGSLTVKASGRRGTIVTCTVPTKEPGHAGWSEKVRNGHPSLVQV